MENGPPELSGTTHAIVALAANSECHIFCKGLKAAYTTIAIVIYSCIQLINS